MQPLLKQRRSSVHLQNKGCEYLIDYEFPIRESYNQRLQLKGAI